MKLAFVLLALAAAACDDDSSVDGASADMATADPVARGRFYVEYRGCATCHQSSDPSAGTLSGSTTPRLERRAHRSRDAHGRRRRRPAALSADAALRRQRR